MSAPVQSIVAQVLEALPRPVNGRDKGLLEVLVWTIEALGAEEGGQRELADQLTSIIRGTSTKQARMRAGVDTIDAFGRIVQEFLGADDPLSRNEDQEGLAKRASRAATAALEAIDPSFANLDPIILLEALRRMTVDAPGATKKRGAPGAANVLADMAARCGALGIPATAKKETKDGLRHAINQAVRDAPRHAGASSSPGWLLGLPTAMWSRLWADADADQTADERGDELRGTHPVPTGNVHGSDQLPRSVDE